MFTEKLDIGVLLELCEEKFVFCLPFSLFVRFGLYFVTLPFLQNCIVFAQYRKTVLKTANAQLISVYLFMGNL